jgi:hypothetical protein
VWGQAGDRRTAGRRRSIGSFVAGPGHGTATRRGGTYAAGGQGQAWLNDGLVGTVTGDLSTAAPYSRLYLANEVAGTTYFDDVVVSNAYNGSTGQALAPGIDGIAGEPPARAPELRAVWRRSATGD